MAIVKPIDEIHFAIAQLSPDDRLQLPAIERHLHWYIERYGSLGQLALAKVGLELSMLRGPGAKAEGGGGPLSGTPN